MNSENPSPDEEEIKQNRLVFLLNKENQTASVVGNDDAKGDVFIPRSIQYKTNEYLVTSIKKYSFKNLKAIISIQVPSDSELRTIEKESFSFSTIQSIFIPSKVSELKECWCSNTPLLTNVIIMPNNEHFIYLDDKMIVWKCDSNSTNYDVIVFAPRDIEKVTIPNFITRIASFAFSETKIVNIKIPLHITKICEGAFYQCKYLKIVEFTPDSELIVIGKNAFAYTSIENISIPPHITRICEGAFYSCKLLHKVEFSPDSELEIIEKNSFSKTSLESIEIPPSVTELEEGWCSNPKLMKMVNSTNEQSETVKHDLIDPGLIVQQLQCPICYLAMTPPQRTPIIIPDCGHSVCEKCITRLDKCPFCRVQITRTARNILGAQLIYSIDQNKIIPDEINPPPPSENKLIPKIKPFCTYASSGDKSIKEKFYQCRTCNISGNNGFCEVCAKNCHEGHDVYIYADSKTSYCDCPLMCNCKCMPKTSDFQCTYELTCGSLVEQPMYQCEDCHILNSFYICQNCAIKCHHGHNLRYVGMKNDQVCHCFDQCECQISKRKPICTYVKTGKKYCSQPVFHCHSCGLVGILGCCPACAHYCHKGHDVRFDYFSSSFFCDCGDGRNGCRCSILGNSNSSYLTSCPNFSHENRHKTIEQRKYHCLTCGIYGSVGICEGCAINCHINHSIEFAGIEKFGCSCQMTEKCLMEMAPTLHNNRSCCDRRVLNKNDISACYICYTCDRNGQSKICETCALKNHLNHDIHLLGYMNFHCCG